VTVAILVLAYLALVGLGIYLSFTPEGRWPNK
jgi:hypothetical protein